MPHHLRYEDDDISEHERLLHEMIAQLQAEYAKAAQPYIDRLNHETDKMGSKHCPFVGKNRILGNCVHFSPGCVVGDEDMIRLPGCKLWK